MPILNPRSIRRLTLGLLLSTAAPFTTLAAQSPDIDPRPAPPQAEGEGPFERLIIRNAILIDGTGAPPRGPVGIVVEGNRIASIVNSVAVAGMMRAEGTPQEADREIGATGMKVLPGFVDLHLHSGDLPQTPEAEYVYKLWLAHGLTTGRGLPFASFEFSLSEKVRSPERDHRAAHVRVPEPGGRAGLGADGTGPMAVPALRASAQLGRSGTPVATRETARQRSARQPSRPSPSLPVAGTLSATGSARELRWGQDGRLPAIERELNGA